MCLRNEQLLTILKEAEAVVNSRPLVYVGGDVSSHITLTPVHLPDTIQNDTDDINYDQEMSSPDRLLTIRRKGLQHLSVFWKMWRDDYLLK